jgi:hypothetical protein
VGLRPAAAAGSVAKLVEPGSPCWGWAVSMEHGLQEQNVPGRPSGGCRPLAPAGRLESLRPSAEAQPRLRAAERGVPARPSGWPTTPPHRPRRSYMTEGLQAELRDLASSIGSAWRRLTAEKRAPYEALAAREASEYQVGGARGQLGPGGGDWGGRLGGTGGGGGRGAGRRGGRCYPADQCWGGAGAGRGLCCQQVRACMADVSLA